MGPQETESKANITKSRSERITDPIDPAKQIQERGEKKKKKKRQINGGQKKRNFRHCMRSKVPETRSNRRNADENPSGATKALKYKPKRNPSEIRGVERERAEEGNGDS